MPRSLRWRQLILGLASVAVVAAIALLILVYGRVGKLRGKTFRVFVTTDAARGVIRGTEVWLDGQKVGLVKGVDFQQPSASVKERVVLAIDLLEVAREHIRGDSRVQIRSGATLIGDQIVYISSGTAKNPVVPEGDTLHSSDQGDLETATSNAALASRELPAIVANVKLLSAQLQSAEGTIGAVMGTKNDAAIASLRSKTERVMRRLSGSNGTVSLALRDSSLRVRAQRTMARADSIRQLLSSDQHSLGRFRKDSTLVREVALVRAELGDVRKLLENPNGTIGRFRTDSALTRAVHRDLAAFDSLFTDLKKHPLRYIAF